MRLREKIETFQSLIRSYNSTEMKHSYDTDYDRSPAGNMFVRIGDTIGTYSANHEDNDVLHNIENKVAGALYKLADLYGRKPVTIVLVPEDKLIDLKEIKVSKGFIDEAHIVGDLVFKDPADPKYK